MPYQTNEDGTRSTPRSEGLQRLAAVHHNIIRMTAAGLRGTQVAALLDITPQTVYNTLATDLAKAELARLRQGADEAFLDVQERLQLVSPSMLDILVEAALDPAESTKLRTDIANTLLDKAGHKPVQRTVTAVGGKIDVDFLTEVKKRAAAIRDERTKALYADAETVEVVDETKSM